MLTSERGVATALSLALGVVAAMPARAPAAVAPVSEPTREAERPTFAIRAVDVEAVLADRLAADLAESCPQRPASERVHLVRVDYADLTGDGREDALVQAVRCTGQFLDVREVWSADADGALSVHPVRDEASWRLWPELESGRDGNPLATIRGRVVVVEWELVDALVPCHPRRGWRRRVEYEWDGDRFVLARFVTLRPERISAGSDSGELARWPESGAVQLRVRQRCAGDATQRVEVLRRRADDFVVVASVEGSYAWASLVRRRGRTLLALGSELLAARGSWAHAELWSVAEDGTLTAVRLSGRGPCAGFLPELGPDADSYWGTTGYRFESDALSFDVPLYPPDENPVSRTLGRVWGTLELEGDELVVATCHREDADPESER